MKKSNVVTVKDINKMNSEEMMNYCESLDHKAINDLTDDVFKILFKEAIVSNKVTNVSNRKASIHKYSEEIMNEENTSIYDIKWSLEITGGILGLIEKKSSGEIIILRSEQSVTLRSGIIFGLGVFRCDFIINGDIFDKIEGTQGFLRTRIH